MKKLAVITALAILFFINATYSNAQQAPAAQPKPAAPQAKAPSQLVPGWFTNEFSDPAGVSVEKVDALINKTCQPSGLDGIQILAVQRGHNEVMNLHIYCRQDKAANVQYKASMVLIPNRNPDAAISKVLANPKVRIGPFYFGKDGEVDAFLVIEKVK
jgi:hypothetical protein